MDADKKENWLRFAIIMVAAIFISQIRAATPNTTLAMYFLITELVVWGIFEAIPTKKSK